MDILPSSTRLALSLPSLDKVDVVLMLMLDHGDVRVLGPQCSVPRVLLINHVFRAELVLRLDDDEGGHTVSDNFMKVWMLKK